VPENRVEPIHIAAVAGLDTDAAVSLNLADQPEGRRTPRSGGSERSEEFGIAEHNPFYRQFPDHLDTTAVADLPDMQGSGMVRDLREAATLKPGPNVPTAANDGVFRIAA
jgi:hypothetical protein